MRIALHCALCEWTHGHFVPPIVPVLLHYETEHPDVPVRRAWWLPEGAGYVLVGDVGWEERVLATAEETEE